MAFSVAAFGLDDVKLPREWRVDRLDAIASFNPEQVTAAYPHSEITYLDIANVETGVFGEPETLFLADAPSRAKRIVRTGDTIVSTVRPGNRAFTFIKSAPDNLVASTGFAVLRSKPNAEPRFVYYLATSDPIINYLASIAEEKTAYPSVSPDDIAECAVPVPPLSE
jgi:type I restriction enzyme S subunit